MTSTKRLRPADLPDFGRPPLVEVALSIQFALLDQFRAVHGGLLWLQFRRKFPKTAEHGPLPPIFETFGFPQSMPKPQVVIQTEPMVPRYWFLRQDESELIQIQNDRFVHNWRKLGPNHQYPRYETIVKKFRSEIESLEKFLCDRKLGSVQPNQCEVTYVNHIELDSRDVDPRVALDRIFTNWRSSCGDMTLSPAESVRILAQYVLNDDRSRLPYGRLYADIQPGFRLGRDKPEPLVQLSLTARGKPSEPTITAAFDTLDAGRAAVVRRFAAITTMEMHRYWGRKDVQ